METMYRIIELLDGEKSITNNAVRLRLVHYKLAQRVKMYLLTYWIK